MYKTAIYKTFEVVLKEMRIDAAEYLLRKPLQVEFADIGSGEALFDQLQLCAKNVDILSLPVSFSREELQSALSSIASPVVFIAGKENLSIYISCVSSNGKIICKEITTDENGDTIERDLDFVTFSELDLLSDKKGQIQAISFLPNRSVFSNNAGDADRQNDSLMKRFARLLKYERREIGFLLLYAIIAGIISLSLPLGVQSIVSFVSSGRIATSVVILIVLIIAGLLISGGMQVMQLYLAERIQQKLFTKAAFEFAQLIPRIRIESVLKFYPPELVNRFFEIVSLQKGTATILLEFSGAVLQIVFGLLLLSLYHPVFIILSIILITILVIVMRLTGPSGLASSIEESKYKYKVANWLEELARSMITFKLMGNNTIAIQKTDDLVSGYLHARNKHFRVLSTQYILFVLFKTLVTGGLLVAGCLLVVNREISLGQFIAAEIVIILVMGAVEKLILKLDTVYDVLTSIDKIGQVTDLPTDNEGLSRIVPSQKGMHVKLEDVSYGFPDRDDNVLASINLEVKSGERLCISGSNSSGKTSLAHIVLGLLDGWEGRMQYDHLPLRSLDKDSLLTQIGSYIVQGGLFDGTLHDNIAVGRKITIDKILEAIKFAGLGEYLGGLNEGLNTRLVGGAMRIPGSIIRKILLARAIAGNPRLLVLDDFLLGVQYKEKLRILN